MLDNTSSLRVLVIDDLEEVRDQNRMVLRSAGIHRITDARDGQDAVRILSNPVRAFDLILCDLQMPNMDGIETIRALSFLGVHGAVAVLSIEDEQIMAGAGFLAEAHGLRFIGNVEKPLTPEKLAVVLQRLGEPAPPPTNGMRPESPTAAEVERALANDEFTFLFHPQIEIRSARLHGVEALLRWRHPQRGLLTDETFMSTVNAHDDLAAAVAAFVLDGTTAFAARWRAMGHGEPVSVNVPGRALDTLDLPERLEARSYEAGIPYDALTIEISEPELAIDPMMVLDVATRLRLKRFGVCIDQFGGTEFGLQSLQHAPVTELKIAREFVHGCATSPAKQGVLDAAIAVARHHGMEVVAEGVRHRVDWEYLRHIGCDVAQGNYVVRPMSEKMLESWKQETAGR